jgi:hypothetical protein
VPPELRNGSMLISDWSEWLAGRIISWGGLKADVVLVYNGDKDVRSVQVGINAALEQPGPEETVSCLEQQLMAIRELTPTWIPVQDKQYVDRKAAEADRVANRDRESQAKKKRQAEAKEAAPAAAPEERPAEAAKKTQKRPAQKPKERSPPQERAEEEAPPKKKAKPLVSSDSELEEITRHVEEESETDSEAGDTPPRKPARTEDTSLQRGEMPPPASAPRGPERGGDRDRREDVDRREDRRPATQPTRERSDSRGSGSATTSSPRHRTGTSSGSQRREPSPRRQLDDQLRRVSDRRSGGDRSRSTAESERSRRRREDEERSIADADRRREQRDADRRRENDRRAREEADRRAKATRSFFDVRRRHK